MLRDRLRRRIREQGPLAVSTYVEAALYDPDEGFYMTGGRAGRRGDFLTAPEVGPLFGAVVARAIDRWWDEQGRPDPYVVHEWGAGPGTLARAVLAAEPKVLTAGALRWHAIEISPLQRGLHPDHAAVASTAHPAGKAHLVLANELLDNLPFDLFTYDAEFGWVECKVGVANDRFVLERSRGPTPTGLDDLVARPAVEVMVLWQSAAREWLAGVLGSVDSGRVVVLDYGATTDELSSRGGWIRTHRDHDDRRDWLDDPGSCDITADVAIDQLQFDHPATRVRTQAQFLGELGIENLVDEGRRIWEQSAGVGDLAALTARSRIREADALLDPAGMGGFVVLEWQLPSGLDDGVEPGAGPTS